LLTNQLMSSAVSVGSTPNNTSSPGPMDPTVSPPVRTLASVTRWRTGRTGRFLSRAAPGTRRLSCPWLVAVSTWGERFAASRVGKNERSDPSEDGFLEKEWSRPVFRPPARRSMAIQVISSEGPAAVTVRRDLPKDFACLPKRVTLFPCLIACRFQGMGILS
jgi:hypothetical protein